MENSLRIAVISDLHCRPSEGKKATDVACYLTSDLMKFPIERNPVESLKSVIIKEGLSADLILCPGDITDRIDQQGLTSGWRYLEDLQVAFGNSFLLATVGNHDVSSRETGTDSFDLIKRLTEKFPTEQAALNNLYWANHYCIYESAKADVVIFNSSYNHNDSVAAKKSQITEHTIKQIENDLELLKDNGKNKIAMCHHHPMKHSNTDYEDGDSIEKGDEFLKVLVKYDCSLVIHGHKHDPQLNYYYGLPVLAAGSFSSMANLLDLGAQNTFHYIEINKDRTGTIKTWVYGPKRGWMQKSDTYFPCFTGFGVNISIENFAKECADWFKEKNQDYLSFSDLVERFPQIQFLIPLEQEKLHDMLLKKYQIQFVPALINTPKGLIKMY